MDALTATTLEIARKYPPRGALCRVDADGGLVAAASIEEATAIVVDVRLGPMSDDYKVKIICDTVEFPAGTDAGTIDALVADALARRAARSFG